MDEELTRIVEEAELTASGKTRSAGNLQSKRAAFGMQLRKVNMCQEKVHTHKLSEM